jgi:ribonuclease BN (tRNA processing enzyme)
MMSRRDGNTKRADTQVVLLGTGTPRPDPARSGPATAIIVRDTPYLVDFGPGVIRRAAAAYQKGVTALGPSATSVTTVFLTHMHADHTVGYPDLILTPWIMGRRKPLNVYGPRGLKKMTQHVLEAWALDIDNRLTGAEKRSRRGITVRVHEIKPGVIYEDRNIRVLAFAVRHGTVENAFGFRFETANRTIVISGDTAPTPSLLDACNGCDVLIHEAYAQATYDKAAPRWQSYRRKYHTSSKELAELARRTQPGLLVLYHRANIGAPPTVPDSEDVLLDEVRQAYEGAVVTGHDLDIF